jgi:hypothetical protein
MRSAAAQDSRSGKFQNTLSLACSHLTVARLGIARAPSLAAGRNLVVAQRDSACSAYSASYAREHCYKKKSDS